MENQMSIKEIHPTARLSNEVHIVGCGNLYIDRDVVIERYVLLDLGAVGLIEIGARSKLKQGCVVRSYDGKVSIGSRTTVGEYSILSGHGGLSIGKAVIIAGHCYLSAADHIYTGDGPIRFQGETAKGILVDDGAWLGARCVVLDGVHIGQRAVVGAGSVVTRSLRADFLCVGSPCREIRRRVPTHQKEWRIKSDVRTDKL